MKHKEEITFHSDDIQEILGHVPNNIIRWGITCVFLVILSIIFFSWLIKYPDIISGQIILTTEYPPLKIISQSTGKITKLPKDENDKIVAGDLIVEFSNQVKLNEINWLKNLILSIENQISTNRNIVALFQGDSIYTFDTFQSAYNALKKKCLDYNQYITKTHLYTNEKITNITKKVKHYQTIISSSKKEIELYKKELENEKDFYQINRELFQEKAIPKTQFMLAENEFYNKKQLYENLKRRLAQEEVEITNLQDQLLDLKFKNDEVIRNLKDDIFLNIAEVKSLISGWQENYLLISPISGTLSYPKNLAINQNVNQNDILFIVVPDKSPLIGNMQVFPVGFGKVKIGQSVRIKLDNYPFQEYGFINGLVETVSLTHNSLENSYRVKVFLPDGLTTSLNKNLEFKSELVGIAEIVTEDLSILERIIFKFRKL